MCEMATCEACHHEIIDASDMVRAVEVIHEQTFGGEPSEPIDGREVAFHREHLPEAPGRYRLVEP
jgi:hypothetical protein